MKHILIVSHNYPFEFDHTFGFFCKNQADALVSVNQQVGVVCPLAYSIKCVLRHRKILFGNRNQDNNGVRLRAFLFPSIPKLNRLQHKINDFIGKRLVDSYMKEFGIPDVIHLHVYKSAKIAIYASIKYNIPLVWTEHFTEIENNQLKSYELTLLKELCHQSSIRLAVSENFRNALQRKLNSKFEYLPNVYDSEVYHYKDITSEKKCGFVFIHVAHINSRKNQRRLLEAFALAYKGNMMVKLKIIGAGAKSSEFVGLVQQYQLIEQVELYNSLNSIEIRGHMYGSDVFVLSSDYETFGVSIIEAMACGLPVISTRCGGPESIIVSNDLGILVDFDPKIMAKAMITIRDKIDLYNSKFIAQYTYSNYSFEAIAAALLGIYSRLPSRRNELKI